MLRKLRERAQSEQGFTLIELLVVILIIGILAAIAIPSFINQRSKGQDAEAKSAAVTMAQAIETCATDANGAYNAAACDTVGELQSIEPTLADAPDASVSGLANNAYTVTVSADRETITGDGNTGNDSVTYTITRNANGTTTRTCTAPNNTEGGCGSDNAW